MKWRKLGRIFDPEAHGLLEKFVGYAQGPQALVFNDFVRVYFSTRTLDKQGKFLSHVIFADFTKDFKTVVNVHLDPVIALGDLGCFDEHGIFPMNVLWDREKKAVLAYTTGWTRRVSVSVDASIGLAISQDLGYTFEKVGSGPVLSTSLHEPFLVGDAFVKEINGMFHMWYIHGIRWIKESPTANPDRVYKIAHATSQDGIEWTKEERQIVADIGDENECQALPTVIQIDGLYHMFFCFRNVFGFREGSVGTYRIGHAVSKDLVDWTREDDSMGIEVSSTGWDSEMLAYPHVFEMDGKVYLLYNGNGFGKYGFGIAVLEKY